MRYFIELSYLGTAYNGWQRQPNAPSVQATLEGALSMRLGATIVTTGAGRTDTGVHASQYFAHFDIDKPIEETVTIYHLNLMLPKDIAIKSIRRVDDNAHCRFDAVEREYTYYILSHKDPFRRATTWQLYTTLNIDEMNRAAKHLLETDDFTSFAKLGSDNRTNICHVNTALWEPIEGGCRFTIRSDRFLRNMIRAIVGTSVDVGRGKITADRFAEILCSRDLSQSSGSAPACGLFLSKINYPPSFLF